METQMTNRWLTGVAAVALTVAGAVTAQAADLPTKKMAPAPVYIPPPFTWTGFYIGANAGAIISTGSVDSTFYANGFPFLTNNYANPFSNHQTGFLGGGQAGYNWQTGAWVLGVETDFDGSTLKKDASVVGPGFSGLTGDWARFNGDYLTANGSIKLNWLGTTRARVGWVVTPDNRLMIYGTGGVAYGGGKADLNVYDAAGGWGWSGSQSKTKVGWAVGGGAEYAITDHITIKGEYLFTDLGSSNTTAAGTLLTNTLFPGTYVTSKVKYEASIIRAGVNYKF